MVACRYGTFLLVFNSTSHSLAIELNTRREIPYLRAPMYYFLYINLFGEKSRKEGIVEAVQAYRNVNVKECDIRIVFKRISFMILKYT